VPAIVCTLLYLYTFVILARVLFSWVRVEPGTALASVYSVIYSITEPVLGPLRRVIPPMRLGMGAIDLSPIIVLVLVAIIC
jgi:YggT family protein